jgi:hypothetical protein
MPQRRTIMTLVILFIIYLGVVYAARQRKVRPEPQPSATASHQVPVTNPEHLLTVEPVPAQTNIQDQLN